MLGLRCWWKVGLRFIRLTTSLRSSWRIGYASQRTVVAHLMTFAPIQIPACPIKELADVTKDRHIAHERKMIIEVEVTFQH